MRIIHLADIHWRGLSRHKEYRESFSRFFDKARMLNPDVIYIGGDIVHNKTQGISPELIDCLCWWFTGLSDIAPTHVILGNHDGLMLNNDRQDAISPIISALKNPNIHLYKKSGVYPVKNHEDFNWCVFSCFDEPGWSSVRPQKNKINIALFHGAVWGSKTDIDFSIEGDVTDDFFDQFDFTLLGDIHKQQFLDERRTIAYPGSTIQQNYGEDLGKGFLFWDIESKDKFTSKFYPIDHSKPFVTIEWMGNVQDTVGESFIYPDGSRFRIRSKNKISHADSNQLQHALKREKEAAEVVFKSESSLDVSKITTTAGILNKTNLRDSSTHKRLIREFYADLDLNDDDFKNLDNLIEKYVSQVTDNHDILRNISWQINSIKFNNLFAYGKDNFINFENLPGITGIFGKNRKGKSSIVGSLMYCLFNTTDRGSIKNLHIINSRKNKCDALIDATVNGDKVRIYRETVSHQTRKGEIYASTSLDLTKVNEEGDEKENITQEQRRETEKILRKMIGTSDDFLMTSLASQGEMNTFIREKATMRKMILTKFLDLVVFEKMHEISKSETSNLRARLKLYPDIDRDEEIDNCQFDAIKVSDDLKIIEREISQKRNILKELTIDLALSDNPDIVTEAECVNQKKVVDNLTFKIKDFDTLILDIDDEIKSLTLKNEKIELVKSDFSIGDLKSKLEIQKILEKESVKLSYEYETYKAELERQNKSIKKLNDVPCGDSFPSCKFIRDSHKDRTKIKLQSQIVEKSLKIFNDIKKSLEDVMCEGIDEKIEKYNALVKRQSDLSIASSKAQIKLNNSLNDKSHTVSILAVEDEKLQEMESRMTYGEESPSFVIRSRIASLENDIRNLDKKRMRRFEKIARLKTEISKIENDRDEFEKIKNELRIYDLFIQAVSKTGIPLQIMMSQLPIINDEISKILQGVVGFTVELEADPDSNSMDVYINYGDSRRIIELASGMEKMMSSLAIRVALINVSSLTKTNMLIIDEGFGALDETNIEACSRLLESLKKWFRNIIVISHVDAIKDAVDNSLEITKNGKDAKVYSR